MLCREDAVQLLRLARMRATAEIRLAEVVPDAGTAPAALARLAAQTALAAGLGADRIVLGLDAGQAVLRRLRFPFTARGKIDLVLGPELESHLPYPLAEAALSWTPTALEPPPALVALAAAIPLAPLAAMLGVLGEHLLAPGAACLDLAGLDALLARLAPDGASLLLHRDGGRLSCLCRIDGAPAVWRALPVPPGETPALADILAREVRMSLAAVSPSPPRDMRLFVSGLTDPAVGKALGRALEAPVFVAAGQPDWPLLPGGSPLPDRFAAAYGIALLGIGEPGPVNFLRGELAPVIAATVKRRGLAVAGICLALLLLTAVGCVWWSYHRLDAAIEAARERTAALVGQAAPDAAPGLTLAQKLSVLRSRLAEQADQARDRGVASKTALESLAAIHQAVGPGGRVRVRRLSLDGQRATIDATADDYNTVEEVKRRLSATPLFTDVEIKGARNVPEKKQVEFQLDMRLAGRGGSGT